MCKSLDLIPTTTTKASLTILSDRLEKGFSEQRSFVTCPPTESNPQNPLVGGRREPTPEL